MQSCTLPEINTWFYSVTPRVEDEKVNREFLIEELLEKGYCRVSKKYKVISRVDREDWLEHMAKVEDWPKQTLHEYTRMLNKPANDIEKQAAVEMEHKYRVKWSRDKMRVPQTIYDALPHSDRTATHTRSGSILFSDEEDVGVF